MIPRFPVYVFDVDGTLVDSARDICGAIQDVIEARGRSGVTFEYLRGYVGRHLIDLFQALEISDDQIEPLIAEYRSTYLARTHAMTSVFPGVAEALAALNGRKSTASIKSTPTTRAMLDQFGLLPYFDHVQGTDGFPAKPEPDVILASLKGLGANPEDCLLVGDSPSDMEAGRRAGVRTCAVRYGYGDHELMARWSPDYWVEDPRELL